MSRVTLLNQGTTSIRVPAIVAVGSLAISEDHKSRSWCTVGTRLIKRKKEKDRTHAVSLGKESFCKCSNLRWAEGRVLDIV